MSEPYYEDESVTLYNGRCEDILPGLSLTGSVHLLTDPPYFKVKDNDWDNQWSKSAEFLDWMGEWLDLAKPHLSADASVWVFASPQMTSAVESVVAQRFRVLNSVRWAKMGGDNLRRVSLPSMRQFVSIWEGIIFAEQVAGEWGQSHAAHRKVFGEYLQSERERAGIARKDVQQLFPSRTGNVTGAIRNWELGFNMPTDEQYEKIRSLFGPGFLTREYGDLQRELERARRTFTVQERRLSEDIWHFPSVAHYPGKHVCEKPAGLLTHMIETTTRPGDTVLDCFAGSGAVLDVARQMGRKAVGIEMDEHWCEQAVTRLSDANRRPQAALDFGEWSA